MTIVGNTQADLTLDHINKMIYLDAVIKESMRVCSMIPASSDIHQKILNQAIINNLKKNIIQIILDDYTIPAGTNIVIPISLMHRLPKYWKNPDKFNPDRFLSKKVLDLPSCVYMPFTYGCRNCIGYKYGVLNMKVMLRTLLRHYKFESVDYISIEEF